MKKKKEVRNVLWYICPQCKMLLLKIDKRYRSYETAAIDRNGEYISYVTDEPEFDAYICCDCGASSKSESGLVFIGEESEELKPLILPESVCKPVLDLWEELKDATWNPNDSRNDVYENGIPLHEPKLKLLLVEYLI